MHDGPSRKKLCINHNPGSNGKTCNSLSLHLLRNATHDTPTDMQRYEPSGEQYETKLQLSLELPANWFRRPHIGFSASLWHSSPVHKHAPNDQYSCSEAPHARNEPQDQKRTEPVLWLRLRSEQHPSPTNAAIMKQSGAKQ